MSAKSIAAVFFAFIMISACCPARADEAAGDDGFLKNTVNAVFDKVSQYTSGEKGIFIEDYDKPEEARQEYSTDALGRKIAEPKIRTTTKGAQAE